MARGRKERVRLRVKREKRGNGGLHFRRRFERRMRHRIGGTRAEHRSGFGETLQKGIVAVK